MKSVAQCHCGDVKLTCSGEPFPIVMCNCLLCQRRTGSPVHIGVWFPVEDVVFEGETTEFSRTTGDQGSEAIFHFCPTCGTSVWWPGNEAGPLAGKVGIAGGCFADPNLPAPSLSIYEKRQHAWINAPEGTPCFMELPDPEEMMKLLTENPQ